MSGGEVNLTSHWRVLNPLMPNTRTAQCNEILGPQVKNVFRTSPLLFFVTFVAGSKTVQLIL